MPEVTNLYAHYNINRNVSYDQGKVDSRDVEGLWVEFAVQGVCGVQLVLQLSLVLVPFGVKLGTVLSGISVRGRGGEGRGKRGNRKDVHIYVRR